MTTLASFSNSLLNRPNAFICSSISFVNRRHDNIIINASTMKSSSLLVVSPRPRRGGGGGTNTAKKAGGRRTICCEVALTSVDGPSSSSASASASSSSSEEDEEVMEMGGRIGARVRVKVPLKVYHVPKVPEVDLSGMEGELKQYVGLWKGKSISANLPFKVQFFTQIEGRGPVKFFAHLKEDEFEIVDDN